MHMSSLNSALCLIYKHKRLRYLYFMFNKRYHFEAVLDKRDRGFENPPGEMLQSINTLLRLAY